MPMIMGKEEVILIELLQVEIEEVIEDVVIEEISEETEVVTNHMVTIEQTLNKSVEDIIKKEHGEVEEVIGEDVFGMSELMKFKLNEII